MSKAPIIILETNEPYLSVGRHFGGVKVFGKSYKYLKKEDAFLREDWIKRYEDHIKVRDWNEFVELTKKPPVETSGD